MLVKAIDTIYNSFKFRSRLEARWAVFFDKLGIRYDYELEGFDIDGVWYLPDFYLPDLDCWVEIKPASGVGDTYKLMRSFANRKDPIICFEGAPSLDCNGVLFCNDVKNSSGTGGYYTSTIGFTWCMACEKATILLGDRDVDVAEGNRILCTSSWETWGTMCMIEHWDWHRSKGIEQAYLAARQARFEHGEKP